MESFADFCDKGDVEKVQDFLLQTLEAKKVEIEFSRLEALLGEGFVWACRRGHAAVVVTMLEDGRVDPAWNENEAIRTASFHERVDILKILCKEENVDPSAKENYAIRRASLNGCMEAVQILLKHPKVNPAAKNNDALVRACRAGWVDVMKLLMSDERVDSSVILNHMEDRFEYRNFAIAMCNNDERNALQKIQWLVNKQGLDPTIGEQSWQKNYLLHSACQCGFVGIVKFLFEEFNNVFDPASHGDEAIITASKMGHYKLVKYLLSSSFDVNPCADRNLAIRLAAERGHFNVVVELLKHEKVNSADDQFLALRESIEKRHWRIARLLLKQQENENFPTEFPFHFQKLSGVWRGFDLGSRINGVQAWQKAEHRKI